jgi:ribosomal-protein-alanine N-acetyltransferase
MAVDSMTARVLISPLAAADCAGFIAAAAASRRLHAPWVSPPLTAAAFHGRLQRMQAPTDFAFAIRRRDDGRLIGYADLTARAGSRRRDSRHAT